MAVIAAVAVVATVGYSLFSTPSQPKLKPQMLGDLQSFKVAEGEGRAIVFGIGRTIGGTLMYVSEPKRYMVKTYVGKSGGKGGSKKKKQYQDVEHISRSYAVGICEGEIGGVRRIWKNGKLVFDGRKGSEWGEENNAEFLEGKEFYLGGYSQLPSPTLQTLIDVDIPAFRGTAYMVVEDEDLTPSNGAVPQYQFEVVRSEGQILTSLPYALEKEEGVDAAFNADIELVRPPHGLSVAGDLSFDITAVLRTLRSDYDHEPAPTIGDLSFEIEATLEDITTPEDNTVADYHASIDVYKQIIIAKVDPESATAAYEVEVVLES